MAQKQDNQVLGSKEQTLFRHLVQNYETKQYKKGLKAAEQILRKSPQHGDTQAMKALILNNTGKQDEAFELCKTALTNSKMKSHVCWHVYGLLYRSVKNYDEAIKAYKFALKLEPESAQIQRDLALLQVQMRDYQGYVQSRLQMLKAKPGYRQNWTAMAIAHHLAGDLPEAEGILQKYEETLKEAPSKKDLEHAEALLYKNSIIAEEGDVQRALDHLDTCYKNALDKTAVMEMRADYLLRLERKDEAEIAYKKLLERNNERKAYYEGLEKALGLSRERKEDHEKLIELYQSYADKSARVDAARRLPLDFLEGDAFRKHADHYLRRMLNKGVPSTFANVKQLYTNPSKRDTIQELVEGYASETPQGNGAANGDDEKTNGDTSGNWGLAIAYFLAQHYNYFLSRDLAKAQEHIDRAISLNPTASDYTYHMTRARIQKHLGDTAKASQYMNEAREMDLKDRYINTKCAKYQLRNDENENAINTMGMFTRKEAVGGPLGDLLDMQCIWYLSEDGESYLRQGKLNLALKRFKALYDIFEVWQEDQFDFHTFSLRKGMIRAYVDMVRWEDRLREHPFFTRTALSAIKIYLTLYDNPSGVKNGQVNGTEESAADKKKAAKKAKREAEKAEAEKKAAAAKKPQPKAEEAGETKKEDADPEGLELLKRESEKPLENAMKFITPMLELSPKNIDSQLAGFEVYLRRGKFLPALKCLLAARELDPQCPKLHEQDLRLQHVLASLPEPLPPKVKEVVDSTYLSKQPSTPLAERNEQYLSAHSEDARAVLAVVRARRVLDPEGKDKAKSLQDLKRLTGLRSAGLEEGREALEVLGVLGAGAEEREAWLAEARKRWGEATVFQQQQR